MSREVINTETGVVETIPNETIPNDDVPEDVVRMYKYAKRKIHELMGDHENEIRRLKKKIDKIDEIMQKKCKHDWERDPPEMYTLTTYTCKKCGLWK